MRIALICGSYPPRKCGVGDYTAHLAAALASSDNQVDVITSPINEATSAGMVRIRPNITRWDFRAARRILDGLREAEVDLVNIQYPTQEYGRQPMVNLLPWLIQARLGLPSVATIHEYSSYTWLGRVRLALTARLTQAVIITDVVNQKLLYKCAGGPLEKYTLIPIGPNLQCCPPVNYNRTRQRARLGAGPASVVLVYFGFISPSKGLDTLLQAFAEALESASGMDLWLWLLADWEPAAERYRPYHMAFQQRLAGFPHRDRIVWTGYLEPSNVSAHLLAADIAILPFSDGASLRRTSLLAVLAHRLPVVSTLGPTTATDELNENHGLRLVPVEDEGALAKAILELARNDAVRDTLAARASQFASTFSWANIAAQALSVYHKVLEG